MRERRLAAAHVFVADLDQPVLDDQDAHHLTKVLRLRAGEIVSASNGRGSWRICRYDGSVALLIGESEVKHDRGHERPLTVAFAVTKGDKPDLVIQKLTELGIDHIVPIITERSIVRWDDEKGSRNQIRWQKIAREAAMQSRGVFIPKVHEVFDSIGSFLEIFGNDVAVAEPEGEAIDEKISTIVVGPEGGFTHQEMALLERRVALPGGILRAETAALAAGVMLAAKRVQHG